MTYKQMLITTVPIECSKVDKEIENIIINKNINNKNSNNKHLLTYKHCEQTYNNNNIFFIYKGVIQ